MDTERVEVEVPKRPRRRPLAEEAKQRALRLGAGMLSDQELLALLTGSSDGALLARLLQHGLKVLAQEPADALLERGELGSKGVSRLLAAAELARRLSGRHEDGRPRLGTPQAIYDWARPKVVGSRREEFHVLCLNPRNVLLRHVRVAEGSVDQCHVDPREALGPAVACRATAVVLVHNHPSGDPEPSVQDVALTRQLRDGARLLCIRLIDHLVLGDTGYVSMLARGLIGEERALMPRLQASSAGREG